MTKRCVLQDTQRTFHNIDGSVRKSDNGYFMLIMDRHMDDYVKGRIAANLFLSFFVKLSINVLDIPGMSLAISTEEQCETELFCGMPLYTTRMLAQS